MGGMQSILCSITFCAERVATWMCCAFLLMMMLFVLLLLVVYGISVGYHYAQTELASFALDSRKPLDAKMLRSGPDSPEQPVVRLVAVDQDEMVYNPGKEVYVEASPTPMVILEKERAMEPDLSPPEREVAKRLIGRFRRSKNSTTTGAPFFRPLRNNTKSLRVAM